MKINSGQNLGLQAQNHRKSPSFNGFYSNLSLKSLERHANEANVNYGLDSKVLAENVQSMWRKLQGMDQEFRKNEIVDVFVSYNKDEQQIVAEISPTTKALQRKSAIINQEPVYENIVADGEDFLNAIYKITNTLHRILS